MTTTADRIAATADPQDLAERRRAARALLKRPLLASGSTFVPSTMTMKLASSPTRNSSITTRWPA